MSIISALNLTKLFNTKIENVFEYVTLSLDIVEQVMSCILFHEMYQAICKLRLKKFLVKELLKQMFAVAFLAASIVCMIKGALAYFKVDYLYQKARIEDVILSSLITAFLLNCLVKVMKKLISNGKFQKDSLVKSHFVIHLTIVIFLTQLSKLIVKIISMVGNVGYYSRLDQCEDDNLYNYDYSLANCRHDQCDDYLDDYNSFAFCKLRQAVVDAHSSTFFSSKFLRGYACSLGESVYIILIMMIKISSRAIWQGQ